MNPTPEKKPVK